MEAKCIQYLLNSLVSILYEVLFIRRCSSFSSVLPGSPQVYRPVFSNELNVSPNVSFSIPITFLAQQKWWLLLQKRFGGRSFGVCGTLPPPLPQSFPSPLCTPEANSSPCSRQTAHFALGVQELEAGGKDAMAQLQLNSGWRSASRDYEVVHNRVGVTFPYGEPFSYEGKIELMVEWYGGMVGG